MTHVAEQKKKYGKQEFLANNSKKSSSVAGCKPDLVWQRYVCTLIHHSMFTNMVCEAALYKCAETEPPFTPNFLHLCLHENMRTMHQLLQSLNVSKNEEKLITLAKLFSYRSQNCTCRQTWSIHSVRSLPPEHPGAQAAAGSQTGSPFQWGRTEWWSRHAVPRRKTSACWPSSCRTGRWWRTRPWRTGSKLSTTKQTKEAESLKFVFYFWMRICKWSLQWRRRMHMELKNLRCPTNINVYCVLLYSWVIDSKWESCAGEYSVVSL